MHDPVIFFCRALSALLIVSSAGCASVSAPPSMTASTPAPRAWNTPDAVAHLLGKDIFEGEAIGIDGHVSDGVAAWRVILADDDAVEHFTMISRQGGRAGQLYAAIGLRGLDTAAYDAAVAGLQAHADEPIMTRFGCSLDRDTVGGLVLHRGPGAISLAAGQRVRDWLAMHKTGNVDVMGGGFTDLFQP